MADNGNDKLRVFVSRKDEDRASARAILDKLSLYGGERLELFAAEDIPSGEDWVAWIRSRLAAANLMLLIFTDPSSSWDWCLYEVGLFTPLSGESGKSVICLHPPSVEPPAPLQHLQAVAGEPEKMKAFLKKFYGAELTPEIGSPINRSFADNDDELGTVAEFICEELRPPGEGSDAVYYHNRHLLLTVDPAELEPDKIPDDSEVVADRMSLELFGLQERPPGGGRWTWGQLEDKMRAEENDDWIEELAQSIKWACEGTILKPIAAAFKSVTSDKTYRPNVHRREQHADGTMTLDVLLVHQPDDPGDPPN